MSDLSSLLQGFLLGTGVFLCPGPQRHPQAAALWLGIVLLLAHGLKAARSACQAGGADKPGTGPAPSGLRPLLLVSLLNPAAWMDTVLITGTVGASLGPGARPGFAGGTVAASLLWFIAIVAGAGHARRFTASARTWRLLDAGVALAMLGMASHLAWVQWQATGP
ncbi:MAG: LysE family transporter [Pseudomonadota bacterium]